MYEGALLTKITIWFALCGYVAGLFGLLILGRRPKWFQRARLLWTFGCAWFLAHVVCAFNYYYDWSHTTAYIETARQTAEAMGSAFGGGVYISYVFTLVWVADVLWWWSSPRSYKGRPRFLNAILHGFMFFIIFNGTVIFKTGPIRWLGVFISISLFCLWWLSRNSFEQNNQRLTTKEGSLS